METTTDIRAEAALAGVLALLVEEREARPERALASVEDVLARAGLTSAEIGAVTGQTPAAVDARVRGDAEGPALWRTLARQRAAVSGAAAPERPRRGSA